MSLVLNLHEDRGKNRDSFSMECPPHLMWRLVTGEFCPGIPGAFFVCVSMSCDKANIGK